MEEVQQQQPVEADGMEQEEEEKKMTVPYVGLLFDTYVIAGLIFMKCELGKNCNLSDDKPMCDQCTKKNKYVSYAYLQPFPFQFVIPPSIFAQLFPGYSMRGISTKAVLSLFMCGIDYFNALFNPDLPFAYDDPSWIEAARADRTRAQGYWSGLEAEFVRQMTAVTSLVELLRLIERRLIQGQGICHFINRNTARIGQKSWEEWSEEEFSKYGTTHLVPWTQDRCAEDKTEQHLVGVQVSNRQKEQMNRQGRKETRHEDMRSKVQVGEGGHTTDSLQQT